MEVSNSAYEKSFSPKNVSQVKHGILLEGYQVYETNLKVPEISFSESVPNALGGSLVKVTRTAVVKKPIVVSFSNIAPNKNPKLTVIPETTRDFSLTILTIPETPTADTGVSFTPEPFEFYSDEVVRILIGSTANVDRTFNITFEDNRNETLTFEDVTVKSGENSIILHNNDGENSNNFGSENSRVLSIKFDNMDNFTSGEKLQFYSMQVAEYEGCLIGSPITHHLTDMSEFPEKEDELATEDNMILGASTLPTPTDSTSVLTFTLSKASLSLKAGFTGDMPLMKKESKIIRRLGTLNADKEAPNLFVNVEPKNIAHVSVNQITQNRNQSSSKNAKASTNSFFVNSDGTAQFSDTLSEGAIVVALISSVITVPSIPKGRVSNPFFYLVTMKQTTDAGKIKTTYIEKAYVTGTDALVEGSASGVSVTIKGIKVIDPLTGASQSGSESLS